MKPLPSYLLHTIGALGLGIIVLLSGLIEPPRMERIDTLSTGPYLVQNIQDNPPTFLYWKNEGSGWNVNRHRAWTPDLSLAWRYADRESAMDDAQKFGGLAVAVREIAP